MDKLVDDVRTFRAAAAVPNENRPHIPPADRVNLCEDLITEEYEELFRAFAEEDLVEIADAMADLIYVVIHAALEYGIPLDKVWAEVQRSNMDKINPVNGKANRRRDSNSAKREG